MTSQKSQPLRSIPQDVGANRCDEAFHVMRRAKFRRQQNKGLSVIHQSGFRGDDDEVGLISMHLHSFCP
jgi:hypothetical protein